MCSRLSRIFFMIVYNTTVNKILFTAPFKYKSKKKKIQQKEILLQHKKSLLYPPNGTHKKYFNEALIMKVWYLHCLEYRKEKKLLE